MAQSEQKPETQLPADSDPWAIARNPELDTEAKLARLRQLEQDLRQRGVALEEGMSGAANLPSLAEVLHAIASLAPDRPSPTSPTKS